VGFHDSHFKGGFFLRVVSIDCYQWHTPAQQPQLNPQQLLPEERIPFHDINLANTGPDDE
jgi:hypothetical protein